MMNRNFFAGAALALATVVATAAQATIVAIPSSTLSSSVGSYSGLDGLGTSLNVSYAGAGSLSAIGPGPFEGLWFGGDQQSDTYTLNFNNSLDYLAIHINAMSTIPAYGDVETIGAFSVNAPSAPSLTFTNIQFTAWDGSTVTSGPEDNGEFLMEIHAAAGQSFTSLSFSTIRSAPPTAR